VFDSRSLSGKGLMSNAGAKRLTTGDAAGVLHARKLSDGEHAVLVDYGCFGTHASQRSTVALQVAQILFGFLAHFDGAACRVELAEVHERRCRTLSLLDRAVVGTLAVAQAQRSDPAEVIYCQQDVELVQLADLLPTLAALGMVTKNDPPAPIIWSGVSQ